MSKFKIVDKHKAVFDWFMMCDLFSELYFNFSNDDNGNVIMSPNEFIDSISDDNQTIENYIDRSKIRIYTFTVITFQGYNTLPNVDAEENINIAEYVQRIAEWIEYRQRQGIVPDFGDKCEILDVEIINMSDGVSAVDENGAKYMFAVRFKYFDKTLKQN